MKKDCSSNGQEEIIFEENSLEERLTKIKHTDESYRLAYYTLLDAALFHRKKFIDKEIEDIRDAPEPTAEQALRSIPGSQQKGLRKMTTKTARKAHNEGTKAIINKIVHFDKKAYEEVEGVTAKMQPDMKGRFNNTVTMLVQATEELLFAKNIVEAVSLLRMYNAGELDILFEQSRKLTNDEKITESTK